MSKKKLVFIFTIETFIFAAGLILFFILFGNNAEDDSDIIGMYLLMLLIVGSLVCKIASNLYKDVLNYEINNISLKGNETYFRDIIKNYSIAELSFIDGFEFNSFYDTVAMLLKLERLNVIKIENEKIVILDYSNKNLKESEKYLLKSVKDGYLDEINQYSLTEIVETECIMDGLIKEISKQDEGFDLKKEIKSIRIITIPMILLIMICFIAIFVFNIPEKLAIKLLYFATFLMLILVIVFPIIFFVKSIVAHGKNQVKYKLSNDGKELYSKLQGLKKYIKDFSRLDSKEKEELQLWDDYLIYSVMFGLNKKIPDKYLKILKKKPDIALSENSDKGIYYRN